MCRVFINYRTGDEEVCAALVDRELSAVFGDDNVFRASKSIALGERFEEGLLRNVWRSDALIAVIGKSWLTAADGRGDRALDNPEDWTRREIVEAFGHGVLVVPLLVNGAQRLVRKDLPDDLAELASRQYQRFDTRDVNAGLDRLVVRLREVCGANEPTRPPAAERRGGIGSISGHHVNAVTDPTAPVNMGSGNQVVQHGSYGDGTTFVLGGRSDVRRDVRRSDGDEP